MVRIKDQLKKFCEDQPKKITFKEWLKSDHFQIKGFFIAFVTSIIPILIFSVILIAIATNRSDVIIGSLIVYGMFIEILKRTVARCLANKKLINSFSENLESSFSKKRKNR